MQRVVIIGGGIAGMEAAARLSELGYETIIVEKAPRLGGHVAKWDRLFPHQKKASEIISALEQGTADTTVITGKTVVRTETSGKIHRMELSDGRMLSANAVLIATGFELFHAERKEEYGYKLYRNVITNADLERMFNAGKGIVTPSGRVPSNIAFIHCVGSRDEKVNHRYCSKVCCATAVKQATELKAELPEANIFCLYMDLRMFDRYYEEMYHKALTEAGINFVRGRLSEAAENEQEQIIIKCEDTLTGRPMKMTMDMVVLMAGMEGVNNREVAEVFRLQSDKDDFLLSADDYTGAVLSSREGIFLAGACTGPRTIPETISEARAAVNAIHAYLSRK